MTNFLDEAEELFPYTQSLRRDFHRHPELGFQEFRTAGIVARELGALGLEVHTGVNQTGVVAMLEGDRPGPVALLRFDMDALPINEQTGAEYASETQGVMHACGHDGHVAVGLTVARMLNAHRAELPGSIKFVFQPAEEGLGGAEGMVKAGVLDNPRPDFTLALHMWNERPLGWLGIADGPCMASSDIFTVRIIGRGGHAAIPNLAIDPVVAAAQVITALQSINSRNISPLESAVLSVTTLKAGEAFNVIPPDVTMLGTVRTFNPAVRAHLLERFDKIITSVAEAMGCSAEIDRQALTPAVINAPEIASQVRQAAAEVLPDSPVEDRYATMGSEDMAYMMQDVPGCFFFIGSANAEKGLNAGHHHPRFDFDERALPRAAALMTAAALRLLSNQ
jgi:amidohydrolase